jgi:diacylglycerol kinase (ATP)
MTNKDSLKIFFIINPMAGSHTIDWVVEIANYFNLSHHAIQLHHLTGSCNVETIKEHIRLFAPHQVVAVGGDGTVKLAAECVIHTDILLGILPAGSANGLSKELGIPDDPQKAIDVLVAGYAKKIHVTLINNHLCIHLSDIGLNAYAMKKFRTQQVRGMWGYFIAALGVLMQNQRMQIKMEIEGKIIKIKAEMIVIANATRYGTGAVINPIGQLDRFPFLKCLKWFILMQVMTPTKQKFFKQTPYLCCRLKKYIFK